MVTRGSVLAAIACGVIATLAFRSPAVPGTYPEPTPGGAIARLWTINVSGFAFAPRELTVTVGDSVRWLNRDPFIHTTAADSGAWSSGDVRPDGIFILVADRAGRFPYHCGAHPTMHGVLVVDTASRPP